jgi:hypothetical protein
MSGSAAPASVRAAHLPVYSHTAVLTGSAIVPALCLIVLIVTAVAWWRRRNRQRRKRPASNMFEPRPRLSAAELDGFDRQQHLFRTTI